MNDMVDLFVTDAHPNQPPLSRERIVDEEAFKRIVKEVGAVPRRDEVR